MTPSHNQKMATINKMKRQSKKDTSRNLWEELVISYVYGKGLKRKPQAIEITSVTQQKRNLNFKMGRGPEQTVFQKKKKNMENMTKYSLSLIIKEVRFNTTMR